MKLKDAYSLEEKHMQPNMQPRSILKIRAITLSTKVHLVKAMVFPVVMYGCESWTVQKAERQRIDSFELRCWRRLLRVPWTARISNQSWVFIGKPDAEAETPILWPPDAESWLIWKEPGAGKDWRLEEEGMTEDEMAGWHRRLSGHEFEQALGVSDGQGGLGAAVHRVAKSQTQLSDWTDWIDS